MNKFPMDDVRRDCGAEQAAEISESERALAVESLIDQLTTLMAESGTADENFDAVKWVQTWLQTPIPALGNRKPADYMKTVEGQKYISNLLLTAQSGTYV